MAQRRAECAGARGQQKGIQDSAMRNKPGLMGPVLSPMSWLQDLTLCRVGKHSEPFRKPVGPDSWQNWICCALCAMETSQ